jgi:surface protein
MKCKSKSILSFLLVLSVMLTGLLPCTTAYAADVTNPGDAKSAAVLSTGGLIMRVGVPMSVLIYVDEYGNVTTPDYLPIINNSPAPIYVRSLTVTPQNGWTLDPMGTDYSSFKIGRRNYWLSINGMDPRESINFISPIPGNDTFNLNLDADVAPQSESINGLDIGLISISFSWTMDENAEEDNQDMNFTVHSITHGDEGRLTFSMTVESPGLAEFSMVPAGSSPPSNGTIGFSLESAGYQTVDVEIYGGYDNSVDYDVYVWVYDAEWNLTGPVKVLLAAYGSETGGGDSGTGDDYEHEGVIPEGYILATDADFSGTRDGEFRYIGSNPYVVVPHVIKGVSVTSYYYMFEGTDVKGVASDNPNITDMSYMFANSTSETLDLTYLDTSNVVNMSGMFYFTSAKNLDLSDFDTSKVTDMSSMFYGYSDTTLDLSGFDTSNVTDMSWMFAYSYFSPDFTNLVTSNVTNMAGMFEGNYSTTLDLTGLDTSSVTDMSNMFKGGRATSYDFSNFDTRNVTNMSNMFNENGATTLDLSNFDTSRLTNMSYMFRMGSVETLDISSFRLTEIQPSISGIFEYADNLTTVYVRAQEDIDYIIERSYSEIPDTINFVIK